MRHLALLSMLVFPLALVSADPDPAALTRGAELLASGAKPGPASQRLGVMFQGKLIGVMETTVAAQADGTTVVTMKGAMKLGPMDTKLNSQFTLGKSLEPVKGGGSDVTKGTDEAGEKRGKFERTATGIRFQKSADGGKTWTDSNITDPVDTVDGFSMAMPSLLLKLKEGAPATVRTLSETKGEVDTRTFVRKPSVTRTIDGASVEVVVVEMTTAEEGTGKLLLHPETGAVLEATLPGSPIVIKPISAADAKAWHAGGNAGPVAGSPSEICCRYFAALGASDGATFRKVVDLETMFVNALMGQGQTKEQALAEWAAPGAADKFVEGVLASTRGKGLPKDPKAYTAFMTELSKDASSAKVRFQAPGNKQYLIFTLEKLSGGWKITSQESKFE